MKRVVFIFIPFFLFTYSYSQAITDSLKRVVAFTGNDSVKANTLAKLCFEYLYIDPIQSLHFGKEARKIAESLRNEKLVALVYDDLAQAYDLQKKFTESRILLNRAILIHQKYKDSAGLGNSQNSLALSYYLQGRLDSALLWHFKALKTRAALADKSALADSYNNIGILYSFNKDYAKALYYLRTALDIYSTTVDKAGTSNTLSNIADVYQQQEKFDSAIYFLKKSILLAKGNNSSIDELKNAYLNMGFCYNGKKNYDNALLYFSKVAGEKNIRQNVSIYSYLLMGLSEAWLGKKNYKKAITYAREGLSLKTTGDNNQAELNSYYYKLLADACEATGDIKEALRFYKLYKLNSDSLRSEENNKNINELSARYETQRKDQQIELLNKENELKDFSIRDKKRIILLYTLGLVLLTGATGTSYYLYRNKQKTGKQLEEKNKIISISLQEKEVLLKEIHHRVKNNLQVVSSLLNLQSKSVQDEKALEAIKEGRDRVKSMALIHQDLYREDNLTGIDIKEYIEKLTFSLFSSYNIDPKNIILKTDIDPLQLDVDTLIPLGLILNELISNALKYAFSENEKGILQVTLKQQDSRLLLEVKDNGKGLPEGWHYEKMSSLGYQLIKSFVQKLKAELKVDGSKGTHVQMLISKYKLIR